MLQGQCVGSQWSGLIALAIAFTAILQGSALAQSSDRFEFSIRKGSLGEVLSQIARVAHVTVSAPSALVEGRSAGPVTGEDSVQGALGKALVNTGLTAVPQADGSFILRKAQEGARADPAASAVEGDLSGDVEAIDVVDTSRYGDSGFKAGDAGKVARIADAPLSEIPLSVGVVTRDAIASQPLQTSTDALRNIAGVTVTDGGGVNFRGFNNPDAIRVNGLSAGAGAATPPPDLLERVEVLKGATSVFTGISSDGGVVNLQTKAANGEQIREAKTEIGTDGRKALSLDFGDTFSNFDAFSWRLAATGSLGRFRGEEDAKPRDFSITPSLSYEGEGFKQDLSVYYSDTTESQLDSPTYTRYRLADGSLTAPIALDPSAYPTNDPWGDRTRALIAKESQEFDLGDYSGFGVKLKNELSYARWRLNLTNVSPPSDPGGDAGAILSDFDNASVTNETALAIDYDGEGIKNTTQLGFVYSWLADAARLDPDNPFTRPDKDETGTLAKSSQIDATLSLTDKLDLMDDRLHLFGLVQNDWWDQTSDSRTVFDPGPPLPPAVLTTHLTNDGNGVSWSIGSVLDVNDWVSVFANAGQGVQPGDFDSKNGRFLPVKTNEQYEAGLRFKLFEDASLSLTAFDMAKTNDTVSVPSTGEMTLIPSRKSRGVEVQLQGDLLPDLTTTLALSYAKVRMSGDAAGDRNFAGGSPAVTGSLWTLYHLPEASPFYGWSFGFGLRGSSSSKAFLGNDVKNNRFTLPGYVLADASAGYEKDNWSVNLKVNNLFDTLAFIPSVASSSLSAEKRRSAMLSLRVKF